MRIGAWSAILGVLAIEIAVLALVLCLARGNVRANRLLAGALAVIAGLMVPFVIGYAGAYDTWPWLSFAPFAVPLALPPLLYGHVLALSEGRSPGWRHWLAPAAQFAWQAAVFPLPLAAKARFDGAVAGPWLSPLEDATLILSTFAYGLAGWRLARAYEAGLRQRRRQVIPARRLRLLLAEMLPE